MKAANAPGRREDEDIAICISGPVCEPGLPARARRTLAWYFTTAWDPADSATPARHYNARRDLNDAHRKDRRAACLSAWHYGDSVSGTAAAPFLVADWAARKLTIGQRILRRAETRLRHRYGGRFVDYLDLDTWSRELLYRAQEAVAAIGASAVLAAGTFDETESGLAGQEWQIAQALADLPPGRSGEGAAWQAVRAHVEALEGYARQVAIDDAELAGRESRLEAAADAENPRLLDITAASDVAATHITGRAQSAEFLAAALRDPAPGEPHRNGGTS